MYRYNKNEKASTSQIRAAEEGLCREVENFMHDLQKASLFCDANVKISLSFGRNAEGKKEISGSVTFD